MGQGEPIKQTHLFGDKDQSFKLTMLKGIILLMASAIKKKILNEYIER